jgi:DNA invertase Pin-like site-specific DNA recombinase
MLTQQSYAGRPAISYVRFSTSGQKEGSSVHRQMEAAYAFAKRHGLDLVDTVEDLGISAFRGKNLEQGQLAELIEAYRSNEIPTDTILLIDDVSRFSRAGFRQVQRHLDNLMTLGVAVAFVAEDLIIDEATYDDRTDVIFRLVVAASGANEFSKQLSRKISASYEARQEQLKLGEDIKLTVAPAWINKETKELIPDRTCVVSMILDLQEKGVSFLGIAKTLNNRQIPTWRKGREWRQSNIGYILQNKALFGALEYPKGSGEVFRSVFPALITEEEFNTINAVSSKRSNRRGAKARHCLSGLIKCAVCGNSMVNHGSGGKRPYSYFTCYSTRTQIQSCGNGLIRLDKLQQRLIDVLGDLIGAGRKPGKALQKNNQKLDSLVAERDKAVEMRARAMDQVLSEPDDVMRRAFSERAREIQKRTEELEEHIAHLKSLPVAAESVTDADLEEALANAQELLQSDLRTLNVKLMRIIERVDVEAGKDLIADDIGVKKVKGLVTAYFRDGSSFNFEVRY